VLRTASSLLIALSALTIGAASAAAQAPLDQLPAVYGGGVIAAQAPENDKLAAVQSTAIGIRRYREGGQDRVALRVTVVLSCGRYADGAPGVCGAQRERRGPAGVVWGQ
jgi:hypothetical protein